VGVREAAHARPRNVCCEPQPDGVAGRGPRKVEPSRDGIAIDDVTLPAELDGAGIRSEVQPAAFPRTKRETRQVDALITRCHDRLRG
jgi:hypothetical protein